MDVIIYGIGGKMGRELLEAARSCPDIKIAAGVDKYCDVKYDFPVYSSFDECDAACDAVIDFSRPETLEQILRYCKKTKTPAVLATTGYGEQHKEMIKEASKEIPVLQSYNMSLGVNLLTVLVKKAAEFLPGFDVEIVEKHHNKKVDSPSGTALMLAESINSAFESKKKYVCGREGAVGARTKEEIGIHSVRGGTVAGVHDVMFFGNDEIVEISHTALSKKIFAEGALRAAQFIKGKAPGLYSMRDLFRL